MSQAEKKFSSAAPSSCSCFKRCLHLNMLCESSLACKATLSFDELIQDGATVWIKFVGRANLVKFRSQRLQVKGKNLALSSARLISIDFSCSAPSIETKTVDQ